MHRSEAIEYARRWSEAWNRRDIDAVLEHFEEDVVFSSPRALQVVGVPTVRGKAALGDYWRASQRRIDSMRSPCSASSGTRNPQSCQSFTTEK